MPYEQTSEWPLAEGVALRFSRSGRPVERYAVVLLILVDGVWREIRRDEDILVQIDMLVACVGREGRPRRVPAGLRGALIKLPS